jgi:hypothetical protein
MSIDSVLSEDSGMDSSIQGEIGGLLDGLGDSEGYVLQVNKPSERLPGKWTFLGWFALSDFKTGYEILDAIGRKYGGGEFRLIVTKEGHRGMVRNIRVDIGGYPDKAMVNDDVRAKDSGSRDSGIVAQMMSGFSMLAEKLNSSVGAEDRVLEKLEKYKSLFSNSAAGSEAITLMQSVDLLKKLGIRVGSEEDTEMGAFERIFERALPLISTMSEKKESNKNETLNENRGKNMKSAVSVGVGSKLKAVLNMLINGAVNGGDPAAFASVLLSDPNNVPIAEQYLLDPQIVKKVGLIDSRILDHSVWFDDFIEHIKAELGMDSRFSSEYKDEMAESVSESESEDLRIIADGM